jgi:D-glycero-alpha-D-manno-heptose-7-phosphate kinase
MNTHFDELTVSKDQSLIDAIKVIEANRTQIAFVLDDAKVLVGVLTNGDVRRFLVRGGEPTCRVADCMNRAFRFAQHTAPREELLKLFDLGFNAVPLIDEAGHMVDFATPDYFPPTQEAAILARARAPVRISFSGGGTDLTYYFIKHKGAVLNSSVALYAHATLIPNSGPEINIHSQDIGLNEHYSSLRELLDHPEKGLLSSVVSVIRPAYGFDLYVHSDFPVGSGLGGSSAVATCVVAAFNEMRLDRWSTYEVAELAFHGERLCFGIAGGWQDQYASAFGGFNLIEFDGTRNLVHPIRLDPEITNELEESLVLCDTGIEHHSGKIHEKQREDFTSEGKEDQLKEVVEVCLRMHRHLIRGELLEFGRSMHEAWTLKQKLSSAISGTRIDAIYNAAIEAGAVGGKLLGAGGGGFFVFFVQPRVRNAVTKALEAHGCTIRPARFEREGVTSWRTKQP